MAPPPSKLPRPEFPTTQWRWVAADPAACEGLEELARAYWPPLYAFARCKGCTPDEAAEVVQDLFAELFRRGDLARLDPARGRLRSFLMACCKNMISNHRAREGSAKRGGDRSILSLESVEAESRLGESLTHGLTAERLFERQWAITLLDRVLTRLDAEQQSGPRPEVYRRLRPILLADPDAPHYRPVAEATGLSEKAVRIAAGRLRSRYRALLREELAATVGDSTDVEEELRHLLAAVSA